MNYKPTLAWPCRKDTKMVYFHLNEELDFSEIP